MTMKLVKEQKKKNRYEKKEKGKNDYADVSAWTGEFCKDVTQSCGAVQKGNKK